ncbi:MAG: flavodoxin domain-containing protein [Candidatus Bathyarchaeota archaeon]|nr:flavodoxin domain-containing protein [Candidatus Bathyarchaeota archaeon]
MRKIFKIFIVIFATLVVLFAAFAAVIFLDLAAYGATASETLTPTGASIGNAIVIYNPGLTGASKTVAEKVASSLQAKGYTVTLAGVKSQAAANTAWYSIIVVGGPVYAGGLTASVKDTLSNIVIADGAKVGIFGSGQGATTPQDIIQIQQSLPTRSDSALSKAIIVKIGESEDLDARAQDFVNQLTA